MKKLIILPLIFSTLLLNAQQWGGSSTTSGLIYRDGRVIVGGTTLIGSFSPSTSGLLEIQSPVNTYGFLAFRNIDNATSFDIGFNNSCCAQLTAGNVPLIIRTYGSSAPITFSTAGVDRLKINQDGTIGIGTSNTGSFKLAVEGKIGARELKVTLDNPWPDYVFNKKYPLLNIKSLEKYISINNHLPGVPSAEQIKENGGVELGQMTAKLMEKVEELTLYLIELKKENDEIKAKLKELSDKSDK